MEKQAVFNSREKKLTRNAAIFGLWATWTQEMLIVFQEVSLPSDIPDAGGKTCFVNKQTHSE